MHAEIVASPKAISARASRCPELTVILTDETSSSSLSIPDGVDPDRFCRQSIRCDRWPGPAARARPASAVRPRRGMHHECVLAGVGDQHHPGTSAQPAAGSHRGGQRDIRRGGHPEHALGVALHHHRGADHGDRQVVPTRPAQNRHHPAILNAAGGIHGRRAEMHPRFRRRHRRRQRRKTQRYRCLREIITGCQRS